MFFAAQCQPRDLEQARAVGRPCRRSCNPEASVCRGGKVCLCDHECGYSCINIGEKHLQPLQSDIVAGCIDFFNNSKLI